MTLLPAKNKASTRPVLLALGGARCALHHVQPTQQPQPAQPQRPHQPQEHPGLGRGDMFDREVELSDRRQAPLTQLHTIRPLLTQLCPGYTGHLLQPALYHPHHHLPQAPTAPPSPPSYH